VRKKKEGTATSRGKEKERILLIGVAKVKGKKEPSSGKTRTEKIGKGPIRENVAPEQMEEKVKKRPEKKPPRLFLPAVHPAKRTSVKQRALLKKSVVERTTTENDRVNEQ